MKHTRKLAVVFLLVSLVALLTASVGFAKAVGNPKGEIGAIDEGAGTLTIDTKDGAVTVYVPAGFDFSSVDLGVTVMVKGDWQEDGSIVASSIKVFAEAADESEDEDEDEGEDIEETEEPEEPEDPEEGETRENAFCTGEKETNHPLAVKIALKYGEMYGITEEDVMGYFCQGYSFGEIMLALMTQKYSDIPVDDVLAARDGGDGWGQIWQELGMIGNGKEGTPPGQVKKDDDKTPPGQEKKEDNPPPGLENKPDKDKDKDKNDDDQGWVWSGQVVYR